jgi:phosphoserine phosphatase
MRGELDFRKALDERVSLLQGVSGDVFTEIAKTVKFNEGAELLINSARKHGIRTVLVSGGFEPVVKIVAEKLGFDRYVCNKTEMANGNLTGKVIEPIVDAETKLNVLHEERLRLTIPVEHVCAVGDGANDLPMLQAAGIGIGFEGKPLVRNGTPYQVNNSNLVSILLMMGIAV